MASNLTKWLDIFLEKELLPASFKDIATDYYVPFADRVYSWLEASDEPLILGVNGGQGTGKSTLSEFIGDYLSEVHGLTTSIISIDDLYLDKEHRDYLAAEVHPLLATRGVPGTHDITGGVKLLTELKSGELPKIPRFNKATDQPFPEETWVAPAKCSQLIILEGWCVGARPQDENELKLPINLLEKNEDPEGIWRSFVNTQLSESYAPLFSMLDHLVMLKTPSFEMIHQWRNEQEVKLAAKVTASGSSSTGIMSPEEITRFISHYERLTRWMLDDIPRFADFTFQLNVDHTIDSITELASS